MGAPARVAPAALAAPPCRPHARPERHSDRAREIIHSLPRRTCPCQYVRRAPEQAPPERISDRMLGPRSAPRVCAFHAALVVNVLVSGSFVLASSGPDDHAAPPTTIPAFSPGLTEYQGRVAVGKVGTPADSVSWDWLGSQVSVTLNHSSYLTLKVATANMGRKMARLRCFAAFGATMGTPTLYPLSEIVLLPSIEEYAIGAWPGVTGGWNGSARSTGVTVTIMNDQEWATGGVVTLLSLTSDGVFVPPVLPKTMSARRMVFIGDSITAGTNLRRPIGAPAYGIPIAPSTPISGIMDDYPLTYQAQLCQVLTYSLRSHIPNKLTQVSAGRRSGRTAAPLRTVGKACTRTAATMAERT